MTMPGFTAEAVFGRLGPTFGNSALTYRYAGLDAPVEPAVDIRRILKEFVCYDECVNECNTYQLDTPVHCANSCYLGCVIAT
jgi:hypothetical protein